MSLIPEKTTTAAICIADNVSKNSDYGKNNHSIQIHSDPFHKDCVKEVVIFYRDFWGRGQWTATGHICFKNKNTTGKQEFEASTIEEMLVKMAEFIKTL